MSTYNISIALADDHPLFRDGLIEAIQSRPGYNVVISAANGKELLNKIEESNVPDVCIVDLMMPVLDGYDTIAALKRHHQPTKALVLTFLEKEYSIIKAIKSGANGYILKDSNPEEILNAIGAVHKYGIYYSNIASEAVYQSVGNGKAELTERELQILKLLCSEESYDSIAKNIKISIHTLHDHVKAISKKLGISSRTGLVLYAVRTGIAE